MTFITWIYIDLKTTMFIFVSIALKFIPHIYFTDSLSNSSMNGCPKLEIRNFVSISSLTGECAAQKLKKKFEVQAMDMFTS